MYSAGEKITIYDIAQELGISIATVSRALNGKSDISEETKKAVLETAGRIGYRASRTAASLSRKEKKFKALYPDVIHDYSNEVIRGIQKTQEELRDFHVSIDMETIENEAEAFAIRIQELANQDCDGVMLIPPEDERKLSIMLRKMDLRNMPLVTMTTDLDKDNRLFSVQSNGQVAGRMAAEMLGILLGKGARVAVVTGQMTSVVHIRTAEGFKKEAENQGLRVEGVFEHHDNPARAYVLAETLLCEHSDLDGIYLATANSVTFCNRLIELGFAGKIKLVASDVFPKMGDFIKEGLVSATIFQNPFLQGRLASRYLFEHVTENRQFPEDEILLDPQIVLRSNLEIYEKRLMEAMSNDILF